MSVNFKGLNDIKAINLKNMAICNRLSKPSTLEKWVVVSLLGVLFVFRLITSIYLSELGVIAQYDIFFDSDPIHYISAISNGWSFGRTVHPGIALLFNVPARIFDVGLAQLGLIQQGDFRNFAPLLIAPIFSTLGGYWWWLAACRLGFVPHARLLGLFLLQITFSQMVFSVVPESFPISGALLCLVLLLTAKAIENPTSLDQNPARMLWLGTACLMSVITVTNGFLCVAVWMGIRFKSGKLRRTITEGFIGCIIVFLAIGITTFIDKKVYKLESKTALNMGVSSTAQIAVTHKSWIEKYSVFDGSEIASRTAKFPADLIASILAPEITLLDNPIVKPGYRFQFKFTLEPKVRGIIWKATGWLLLLCAAWYAARNPILLITRAVGVVIIFNGALHSFFGLETFLYSQHWLAFVVIAVLWPFKDIVSPKRIFILYCVILFAFFLNFNAFVFMFDQFNL